MIKRKRVCLHLSKDIYELVPRNKSEWIECAILMIISKNENDAEFNHAFRELKSLRREEILRR